MAIKTRQTDGTGVTNENAPLTNEELDNNFIELVAEDALKANLSGAAFTGQVTISTSTENALDILAGTNNQRLLRLSHPTSPTAAGGYFDFNSDGTTDDNVVTFGVEYSGTDYDVLNIQRSTQRVGIGTISPSTNLDVVGANNNTFDTPYTILLQGTDAYNSGNAGSGIVFTGEYNSSEASTTFATISGVKENITDGNFTGALLFGTRKSSGTDIESMRIDSSGNLLISGSNTTPNTNSAGTTADNEMALRNDGLALFSAYKATTNVGVVMDINRTSTDGGILGFRKNGTTVGSIGTRNGYLHIRTEAGTNGSGIRFSDGYVMPCASDGSNSDATTDLGLSGSRFKDLYLSGDSYITFTDDNSFSASTSSWHNIIVRNTSENANNSCGIVFELNDTYHQNAGTGIAAVKANTSNDYGADLVIITRPESAAAVERMRVTNDGKVGINEDDPSAKLHVNSGTIDNVAIFESTDQAASIRLKDNSTYSAVSQSGSNFDISSDAGNTDDDSKLRLLTDGAVRAELNNIGMYASEFRAINLFDLAGGTGNSYDHRVILLAPLITTSTSHQNRVNGRITMAKTGGNVCDFFDVYVNNVYTDNRASFISHGQRTGHKFVSFDYDNITWLGIEFAYTANPYNEAYFIGQAITDISGAAEHQLKVISYKDTQSGTTVLNQEIYDSIADYTPNGLAKVDTSSSSFLSGPVTIDNSDDVGLTVKQSATRGGIRLGGGNGTGNHRLYFQADASNAYIDSYGGDAYNSLSIEASPLKLNNSSNGAITTGSGQFTFSGGSTGSYGPIISSTSTGGPAIKLDSNGTNGKELWLISNASGNTDGGGRFQFWNNSDNRTFATFAANAGERTKLYNPVEIAHTNLSAEPYSGLHIKNTNSASGAAYTGLYVDAAIQSHIRLATAGSLKWQMRTGTTTSGELRFYSWDGSADVFTLASNGNATLTGELTVNSDERIKDNIEQIDGALEKVQAIRGVTFNRTDTDDDTRHAGVIAQEVEKVLPEVVKDGEDGIKSVAYANMVGLLIEAIKEQQTQIDDLKAEVTRLKGFE
jgi:hypothetical protein